MFLVVSAAMLATLVWYQQKSIESTVEREFHQEEEKERSEQDA